MIPRFISQMNRCFASDYIWNFGDGTEETDIMNPVHFFPNEVGDVFYPVELKAYNYLGCVDSVTLYMNVKGIILFYIPNTFTHDETSSMKLSNQCSNQDLIHLISI
jgi:hypothetical protein